MITSDGVPAKYVCAQVSQSTCIAQVNLEKSATYEEICAEIKRATENEMKEYYAYTDDPLVSSDFVGITVGGCFDAYQKEIKIMTYADIADVVDESNVGLKGSPTFVAVSTTKEAKGAGTVLKDLTADEAVSAIVEKLAELHII